MSERIRVYNNLPTYARGQCASEDKEDPELFPKSGVRESSAALSPTAAPSTSPPPLEHPSNRLIAQLNKNWRVVDDPLQWVLERRKGKLRKKTPVG